MPSKPYLNAPLVSSEMPGGIPYIIGNEAAERFSFYGMRAILVIFMTRYLLGPDGELSPLTDEEAKFVYHQFVAAVYFLPFLGALLADAVLGKYRTIISLSIVYCLGHLTLALDETQLGLTIGLVLIAVGSGGIKPCVSAHVGDQFGASNRHLLEKVFGWFYFSINLGSFFSTLLTPVLLELYGPSVAFGVPGVLMFLATVIFWAGRHRFVHIPPGGRQFVRETFSRRGVRAIGKLLILYVFVAMFWSLFDQTGSAWVLQADKMDRNVLGFTVLPSQLQAINPILVMLFIPLFTYGVYPAVEKVYRLTPLRKITIGLFVTAASFAVSALIEESLVAGESPHVAWQALAYAILTAGEIMVSITCLEFSYTQAPKRMKSLVMAAFFLSIWLGNQFTSLVNWFIQAPDGTSRLPGAQYYWFFTLAMLATAVAFIFVAANYRERTYLQNEAPAV